MLIQSFEPARRRRPAGLLVLSALLSMGLGSVPAWAGDGTSTAADAFRDSAATDTQDGYFSDWFKRVDAIQAEQPHWMTPVATVTPRLEQEFRFDANWERLPNGGQRLTNFDGGKGLELIPWENVEVLVNLPAYEIRDARGAASENEMGFGDWSGTIKYRLASADEQHGNYIVTAFLGFSTPSGIDAFTTHTNAVTPTLAFGKGFGDFDIQSTIGETFPMVDLPKTSNQSIAWNTTFQYHVDTYFWPEFEVNETWWANGPKGAYHQAFLTPGIVFGRFPLIDRTKAIVGVGYQMAIAPSGAMTPAYRNNLIVTARLAF